MSSITRHDTIYNDQFPSGTQAYAACADRSAGDQLRLHRQDVPEGQHLSISLSGGVNADVLDVEEYAAVPGGGPRTTMQASTSAAAADPPA